MRTVLGLLVALSAVAPRLSAQGTVPGFVVETQMTSTQKGMGVPDMTRVQHIRTYSTNGKARTDFQDGINAGEYTLMLAGERAMLMVQPAKKSIRVMSMVPADLQADLALHATVDTAARAREDLGDGPTIAGHRTRHFRSSRIIALNLSSLRSASDAAQAQVPTESISDTYVTAELADLGAMEHSLFERVRGTVAPSPTHDVTLRSEIHTRLGTRGAEMVLTTEVISITPAAIDTALFVVPADFQRVNLFDQMRAMRAQVDSITRNVDAIVPGMAERRRAMRDSLFGPADTLRKKKP